MRPERRFKGRNGQGRFHLHPKLYTQTPPDLNLLQAKNGLDNGVHLTMMRVDTRRSFSEPYDDCLPPSGIGFAKET